MIRTYLTLALILLPLTVNAGWKDKDGKFLPDQGFMQSNGEFGAQLLLTSNDKETIENWKNPKDPVKLTSTSQVKKNDPISAFVIFAGCTPDASSHCDVTVKYKIIAPDQSIYADTPESEIWQNKPAMPTGILQLGASQLKVIIENNELTGKYLVYAYVSDNIAKKTLELKSYFIAEK